MTRSGHSATRSVPATHQVHDLLRRLILDGELAPGQQLSQLDIVRRFSVGRTPLREALRLLQREGLVVDGGAHSRVTISPLSMDDLDELYSLRILGESVAVSLTVPVLTAGDIDAMDRDAVLAASGDADAHRRLHATLRSGAGPRVREHLARLFEHAERYQRAFVAHEGGMPEHADVQHRRLVDACRSADPEGARAVLIEHLAGTATSLMATEGYTPALLPIALDLARSAPGRTAD